eukprot:s1924_g8.t1
MGVIRLLPAMATLLDVPHTSCRESLRFHSMVVLWAWAMSQQPPGEFGTEKVGRSLLPALGGTGCCESSLPALAFLCRASGPSAMFASCCAGDSFADLALEANFDLVASTDDCIAPYLALTSGKSSDALPSSSKGQAREAEKSRLQTLLRDFAQKAVKGCPCVYFKEGTSERSVARYRMDRLLETLMLVNGQDPNQLEVSCPVVAIQDIYTMVEDGPSHFPPEVVAALKPEEKDHLLMIVFKDASQKFAHLCIAQESKQSCEDFLECMRILSIYAESKAKAPASHRSKGA